MSQEGFSLPLDPEAPGYTYGSVLPLRRQDAPGAPLELAVPGLVRSAVNDLAMTLEAPKAAAAGQLSPEQAQALAPKMAMSLMGVGMGADTLVGEASPEVLGSFRGYHGTPYTFEPVEGNPLGKFKNQAIGSGEGAQVYGWGHYVAGARETAEEYKRNLSSDEQPGSLYHVEIRPEESELLDWDKPLSQQSPVVQAAVRPLVMNQLERQYAAIKAGGGKYSTRLNSPVLAVVDASDLPKVADKLTGEELYNRIGLPAQASEILHSAGVPGIKYLDQLSRGRVGVANDIRLNRFGEDEYLLRAYDAKTGQKLTNDDLHDNLTASQVKGILGEQVTNDLLQQVEKNRKPGTPFAAAFHSGPVEFKGTSNYVIFHPDDLKIVGRNGQEAPQQIEQVEHDPFSSSASGVADDE